MDMDLSENGGLNPQFIAILIGEIDIRKYHILGVANFQTHLDSFFPSSFWGTEMQIFIGPDGFVSC